MDEQRQSPFFILGVPRSGTTLLEQMLDAHTQIGVSHEISAGIVLWRLNANHFVKDQWMALLILNYFYNRTKNLAEPMVECLARQALRPFNYPVKTKEWFDTLTLDYLNSKGAFLFGEKTPENIFFIPTLSSVFPDSKYVVILRNPIDIVLSICEIAILKLKVPITDRLLLHFAALVKRGLVDIFVKNNLKGKAHIFIKYEDLILDTENTLKLICKFLEMDYEIEMQHNFKQAEKFVSHQDLMKLVFGRANEPITEKRINRSNTSLQPAQISFLYRYLSPEISYLPYEFSIPKVQISLVTHIRVYLAKLSFYLQLYMLEEYKNKVRFQLHYFAIRFLGNTQLNPYLFKNLIWNKRDWEIVLEQRTK